MIKKGVHGDYTWFQSTENYLSVLLDQVKDLVIGRHVAIVAHEGEPLQLTTDELRLGWQQLNTTAVSPRVERTTDIPQNQFDEWYTFAGLGAYRITESFATYGGFTLDQSSSENPFLAAALRQKQESSPMRLRQQRFWLQMEQLKPESYIAETDKLFVVTRNPELIGKLNEFFDKGHFRLPNNARLRRRGLINYSNPKKLS